MKNFALGNLVRGAAGQVFIDIAQGHDFAAAGFVQFVPVVGGAIVGADDADVQTFVGGGFLVVGAVLPSQKPNAPAAAAVCRKRRRVRRCGMTGSSLSGRLRLSGHGR